MKKILLSLAAFAVVLATSAQSIIPNGWYASFEPVSESAELKGVHTATAADGSVYVSGTYNKAFTFAGTEVADPEGLTSASIVKYDGNGQEQWAVTLMGSAVVNALDADADGTLYAAGSFMDAVIYTGADGTAAEICSEGVYSFFLAKISKDGKFEAIKSITPTVNEEIAAKVGDPWGMGFDSPLYSMWDPIYITPNKVQVDGNNVYVSAKYMGDVAELGWKGSYIDQWGMMYMDNYSMGVFSLDKEGLDNAKNVANVQMTGVVSDAQYYPEAMTFAAENGTVYVGFIGFKNLTLTTPTTTENFTFAAAEDGSTMEHAFVLATIGEETTTKVFNTAQHDKLAKPYNLFMNIAGDNVIIGGTFYGQLPFDAAKNTGELASDIFVASVAKATGAVNWTFVGGQEAEATCMAYNNDKVLISSSNNSFYTLTEGEIFNSGTTTLVDADAYGENCMSACHTSETKVHVSGFFAEGGGENNTQHEGWVASYESVSDAAELKGVHTATAADGSVYVSGTYNKAFTFAGTEVADPEGLTSASIVKYDGNGQEQWAVTLMGSAVVNALDADADGTLYAAGSFMDAVIYTGADGTAAEICSEGVYSFFLAKISKDGKFEAIKSITPTVNEEIAAKVGDPWGMGFDSPLYSMWDPIYITPNKVQVDGNNVYVSAKYMGDVAELGWKGSYIDQWGMMYMDNYSMGVFSLDKEGLDNAKNVANVQMTGVVSDAQYYPEAMTFAAENGTVYVGFIGFKNLTLTTPTTTENFTFAAAEDGSTMEHAFVLATIGEETTTKVFNTAQHDKLAKPYNLFMNIAGDNVIIGGTFYGQLPFDAAKNTGELASDIFVASVAKATGAVNWTFVGGQEAEATCMTGNEEKVIISSTDNSIRILDVTNGEVQKTDNGTLADADAYAGQSLSAVYTAETIVHVWGKSNGTENSIEEVTTPAVKTDGIIYNISGQIVDKNYKGIVIKNGKKYLVK